jgi:hypothetical protein
LKNGEETSKANIMGVCIDVKMMKEEEKNSYIEIETLKS